MADVFDGLPPTAAEEEEFRRAIEEQLRTLHVDDVVMQTVATLMTLAARRLGIAPGSEGERDLDQARMAIDAARALAAVLPEEMAAPMREPLSQVQMAFVQISKGGAPEGDGPGEGASPPAPAPEPAVPEPAGNSESDAEPDDAARAEARSRIWTPPGT